MRKLFIGITLCLFIGAWSQTSPPENYNTGNFPRTPNAASLATSIDIPSGSYTGVASFSIPIYMIDFNGKPMPIELDYTTTGVKIGQIASRTGLGWALNAGGVSLSRQAVGFPDLGYRPIVTDIDSFNPENSGNPGVIIEQTVNGHDGSFTMVQHPLDMKPDLYSYSILGGGGKFIFDSGGDFGIPIPFSQIKISYSTNGGITIIDEQGIKYEFDKLIGVGNKNTCTSHVGPINVNEPDYKIRKITDTNGQEVVFNYSKQVTNVKYISSLSEQFKEVFSYINNDNGNPSTYTRFCVNYAEITESLLTEINFPGGQAQFLYSDDISLPARQDITGDVYLKRIVVLNNAGNTIRDFTLNYDYFQSITSEPHHVPSQFIAITSTMKADIYKRLKLEEVIDNLTLGKYTLSYYEDKTLPHRLSFSQDHWGVYNGKQNEETSISTSRYQQLVDPVNFRQRLFFGADKSPDISFGVTGNLKEIKYPAGGYTSVFYEADDYYVNENKKYSYSEREINLNSTSNPSEIPFTMSGQGYEIRLVHAGTNDDGSNGSVVGNCKLEILTSSGQPVQGILPFTQYGEFSLFNKIPPGSYKLKFTDLGWDIDNETIPVCTGQLTWYEENFQTLSNNKQTGTIRVNKIISGDSNDGTVERDYLYKDPANPTRSSGINHGDELNTLFTRSQYPTNNNGGIKDELTFSSSPGLNLFTVSGKPVGYTYVQEKFISPNKSYRKDDEFTNELDDLYVPFQPYQLVNYKYPNLGMKRGLVKKQIFLNSENDTVKVIKNDYLWNNYPNTLATSAMGNQVLMQTLDINIAKITCGGACIYKFNYDFFPMASAWIQSIKTTTTDYINGQPKMVTEQTTAYSPNPPKHTFPIFQTTQNSLGETLTTEYQYPQDLPGSPHAQDLINENRVSMPLVTKTAVNGSPTSIQETVYEKDGTTGNIVLPKYVYAKKGASSLDAVLPSEDLKITYDLYDDKGNLKQYTLADGTPVSIVWGYNGQYPIAKVEGVPYSSIQSQAGALVTASNGGTLTESSFNALRTAVTASSKYALLTCYIYKPLIGITTIIQPNGQKEIYEYDASGRLMQVKDHNGKVIKKIDYNYQH